MIKASVPATLGEYKPIIWPTPVDTQIQELRVHLKREQELSALLAKSLAHYQAAEPGRQRLEAAFGKAREILKRCQQELGERWWRENVGEDWEKDR